MEKNEPARARHVLAFNVRELRLQKKISQEKMAELAGFHRTYVSQVERSVVNVSVDNVQKMADKLEVPVARLFQTEPYLSWLAAQKNQNHPSGDPCAESERHQG